jgi:hypothetical protein
VAIKLTLPLQNIKLYFSLPFIRNDNSVNINDTIVMFAWLISHQPAVLFSQNKPATSNQPTVLFSRNKPAPAISHQPNEQAEYLDLQIEI